MMYSPIPIMHTTDSQYKILSNILLDHTIFSLKIFFDRLQNIGSEVKKGFL